MKTITKALGGLVAAIALALPAQADPLTLAELFAGQSITAGDKVFDNWTNLTDPGFFSSDPTRTFNPGNITVTSLGDGGDDPGPGLRFAVLDGELNIGGDGGYAFIDLAFEMGPIEGMGAGDIKRYIRYIADRRLTQLGLQPIYRSEKNPLPWLDHMLNAVEHTNFFENRATEYSKASTRGSWEEAFA